MCSDNHNIAVPVINEIPKQFPCPSNNYGEILQFLRVPYKPIDYYLQVGEITKVQGWILHLSVVISQVQSLLELVIPFLIRENTTFKIAANKAICEDILNGNMGVPQLGKIVCIYPETDLIALHLAKKIILLTSSFKGPVIPTDICLGNIVYTRYGGFAPITQLGSNGNEEKYIYDPQGQLIRDFYPMPFQLPKGIRWPFNELASATLPYPKKVLRNVYKVLTFLKIEPRGNVFKGIYLKSLFNVKKCVIKQGYKNMASDAAGRDIQDRLIWQYDLYKDLADVIPMPVIFDKFQEEEGTYLVMEYISGVSLYDKLPEINPHSKSWQELPIPGKLRILNYLINITSVVHNLHKRGYVHRDIVSVNFLIDKKDSLFLIDNELAYSLNKNYPSPAFSLGTAGFMSPEQQALQTPTTKEDIYGLGATLLEAFTGLTPIKFSIKNPEILYKNLFFFIGHQEIATMITACLSLDPQYRPDILIILDVLTKYQHELQTKSPSSESPLPFQELNTTKLRDVIMAALEGLTKPPIIYFNDCWYSKKSTLENSGAMKNKQYSIFTGISEGLGGVLYLLARLHATGMNIDTCRQGLIKSWEFIDGNYFKNLSLVPPGLYTGAAGLALSLSNNIQSGLLLDNPYYREKIKNCLEIANAEIDLANGIVGQGVSILQCKHHLSNEVCMNLLNNIISNLLNMQQKDGSWVLRHNPNSSKIEEALSFGHGIPGVIWFLLEYISIYPNREVQTAVEKSLKWLLKKYKEGKEQRGIILTFIKAYESLHEDHYKKLAETALLQLPSYIVKTDFTQQSGLAGIGELYLEAERVFNRQEWKYRADWIANVYIHSLFRNEDGSGHWIMEENNPPTADFMVGNSGIIHFLARSIPYSRLGYRLLN